MQRNVPQGILLVGIFVDCDGIRVDSGTGRARRLGNLGMSGHAVLHLSSWPNFSNQSMRFRSRRSVVRGSQTRAAPFRLGPVGNAAMWVACHRIRVHPSPELLGSGSVGSRWVPPGLPLTFLHEPCPPFPCLRLDHGVCDKAGFKTRFSSIDFAFLGSVAVPNGFNTAFLHEFSAIAGLALPPSRIPAVHSAKPSQTSQTMAPTDIHFVQQLISHQPADAHTPISARVPRRFAAPAHTAFCKMGETINHERRSGHLENLVSTSFPLTVSHPERKRRSATT